MEGRREARPRVVAAMDCVFGVVGSGFAVVAAGAGGSGALLPLQYLDDEQDRAVRFDSHVLLGVSGHAGECARFKHTLRSCVSGARADTAVVAGLAHGVVHGCAYAVDAVVAGYDKDVGPSMYCVGAASVLRRVENAALGCGSKLCAAVIDRHYRAGMTVKEAVGVVDKCIREVRRLGGVDGAPGSFVIKIVDKDGVREYARRRTCIKETTL